MNEKLLRQWIRHALQESVSLDKVQVLAKELAAAENKGNLGDIGEEIALLYQSGENLNDSKQPDFPFADVTSGPTDRLKDIGLYSVKATGAKRTSKSGFYTAKNAFGQSEIHTSTAVTMVNKKGWGGFRTEIDEQFGEDATEVELNLGAIAISVVPNRNSGEPESLRVWKYGPKKVKFRKNEKDLFEPVGFPLTTITSDKKAAAIFGPRQVLSSASGELDLSGEKLDILVSFDPYANPKERAKAKEKIITMMRGMEASELDKWIKAYEKISENVLIRQAVQETLLTEDLTGSDKADIKRMIKKELEGPTNRREVDKAFKKNFDKELKKALGVSFFGTPGKINKFVIDEIQKEVIKNLDSKASKDVVIFVCKEVIKKLYRELSFSSPQIIDRINPKV